ncbi:MAG TPA: hypothetical protein VIG39_10620 [Rhizomicrobium sp.]|jgi:hypothetical protein
MIAGGREMQEAEILDAAFQLLDQFRGNAELRAGEEMDRAVERGDAAGYDHWRRVAEIIVAARGRRYPVIEAEEDPPVEAVLRVRARAIFAPA